ncbi:MAG: EamA family transporter [Acidobacteria bacterium]|nr:EamA family transporter [Acidobacteriota bacterium]
MKIFVWLILCLIWGTTWIFIKIGLEDLPPITFAVSRFLLSAVLLLPVVYFARKSWPQGRREWQLIALTGILQFTVNYSTVFWAEQYITSGLAAVLQAMITVFGLVLAWIFLPSERITPLKIIAVLIGIVGVGVIFLDQLRVESAMAFAGSVAIVLGAYAAAQASILVKAKAAGIDPAMILLSQMFCGLPPLIIYAIVAEGSPLQHNWGFNAVASVLYLSIAGTIAAFWLYYWLLARIESTKAMMISLVTPLIAVLVGNVFLGETLPPQTLIGGLLILSSIGLIVFRRSVREAKSSELKNSE